MGIKAVFFDLDNTLYDFMDAHEKGNEAVRNYVCSNFSVKEEEYPQLLKKSMRITSDKVGANTAAIHSRALRFQTMLELLGESAIRYAYPMSELYWNAFYDNIRTEPVVKSILAAVKDAGKKIIIATDMTAEVQFEKIRILGIGDYIDYLVTSEEAGAEKPDKRFFELCIKKAGISCGEGIVVGDHPLKDVKGACDFGMTGVWCRHFDPKRFMDNFDINVDNSVLDSISYIINDYNDCFDGEGRLEGLGGIALE